MPINDEQAKSIKEQILKQIEQLPEDKREQARQYITNMSNEQLEEFIKNNSRAQQEEDQSNTEGEAEDEPRKSKECIMCMLSNKKIESKIIYEDKDYLAALEIKPYAEGQTILISKKHIKESKELPTKAFTLAKKIGRYLLKKLAAESFELNTSEDLGHAIINIIPLFKDKKITYQRKQATKEELEELKRKIGELRKKEKVIKIKTEKSESKNDKDKNLGKTEKKLPQYSRRIP
jgi:histidine triad (HIT) family protein